MKWYDPIDTSTPIVTPQAVIDGYIEKKGKIPGFGISKSFLMLETANDIIRLGDKFKITEEPFLLPAFLKKHPIYTIGPKPGISAIERAFCSPIAVDALEESELIIHAGDIGDLRIIDMLESK